MVCSPEQARLIVDDWRSRGCEIRAVVSFVGVRMGFNGKVTGSSELIATLHGETGTELSFDMSKAKCEFGDRREAIGSDTAFESVLSIRFANGTCLFLAERRN
jgi:hypothetical protein